MSADPFPGYAWLPQSLHAYCYVGNDPVNYRDPSGLWPEPWGAEVLCRECRDDIPAECMDANCNIIAPIGHEASVDYLKAMMGPQGRSVSDDLSYFRLEDPVMLLARLMYGEAADAKGTELQQRMSLENVGWIAKIRHVLSPHIPRWSSWHDVILGSGPSDEPFHGIHEHLTGPDIYKSLRNPWGNEPTTEAIRWKWCYVYRMARIIYEASPLSIPKELWDRRRDSFTMDKTKRGHKPVTRRGFTDQLHVYGTEYGDPGEAWDAWKTWNELWTKFRRVPPLGL